MHLHIISSINPNELKSSNIASNRLRLSYVYSTALDLGYKVTGGLKIPVSADVYYFGKITTGMKDTAINIINILKTQKTQLIVDYTDDLLDPKIDTARSKIYEKLMSLDSIITVPVYGLGKKCRERNKTVFVIPDGIDNISNLDPLKKNNKETNVLWNGHNTNINSLIRVMDSDLINYTYNIHVVSNIKSFEILKKTKFRNVLKCKLYAHKWNINKLQTVAKKCDFAILPTDKPWASSNRLITNFRLGLPVLAETIESYSPFIKYYSEFNRENIEKMFDSPESWHNLVRLAQKIIYNKFNQDRLKDLWKKVLIYKNSKQ